MTALGGKGRILTRPHQGDATGRRPPSPRAAEPWAQGKRLDCVAGYPLRIQPLSLQVWVPARRAARVPQMSYSPARCRMSLSSRVTTVLALLYRQRQQPGAYA